MTTCNPQLGLLEEFNTIHAAVIDERTMSWWMAFMTGEIDIVEANRHAPIETIWEAYKTFLRGRESGYGHKPYKYYEVWTEDGWEIAFWDGSRWYFTDLTQKPEREPKIKKIVRMIEPTTPDYVDHPVE